MISPTDAAARRPRLTESVGRGTFVVAGVAAAVVLLLALTAARAGTHPVSALFEALAFAGLAGASVMLIVVDVREHRLPDAVVGPVGAAGCVLLAIAALGGGAPLDIVRALAGALALGGSYAVVAVLPPGALGGGDVKLAAVIGLHLAWLGWDELLLGAALAFVAGGAHALVLIVSRRISARDRIPFGPAMLAGAWAAIVLGWG